MRVKNPSFGFQVTPGTAKRDIFFGNRGDGSETQKTLSHYGEIKDRAFWLGEEEGHGPPGQRGLTLVILLSSDRLHLLGHDCALSPQLLAACFL